MDRHAGITLMELLAGLAILGLITGLAVPALDRLVLNARRTAAMENLLRAAWFARMEAVQRGRPVLLCPSASGLPCTGMSADWNDGWQVAPADDPGGVLRAGAGLSDSRVQILSNRAVFRFEPHDRRSTNGTLAWCDYRGTAAARALVISATGRPRLEPGSGSLACAWP